MEEELAFPWVMAPPKVLPCYASILLPFHPSTLPPPSPRVPSRCLRRSCRRLADQRDRQIPQRKSADRMVEEQECGLVHGHACLGKFFRRGEQGTHLCLRRADHAGLCERGGREDHLAENQY